MNEETKTKIANALRGSQIGAIVACALGVEMPAPRFTSKAVVTSDGYLQANFVDSDGVSRHSAFIGSFGELEENVRRVLPFLQTNVGLNVEESEELRTAVLSDWIAIDYR